jgi:cysteine desulfurase/selenocysteine lyase
MNSIRSQFPILSQSIGKYPLVYLDNAATTQKPLSVIEALNEYYLTQNSNIHRGAHHLANKATELYENSRNAIAQFIGAKPHEVNFTKGTTESINLLMYSFGKKFLKKGDAIVLTEMEHHANLVPWLHLKEEIGIEIRYLYMNSNCELDMDTLEKTIDEKVKLVSMAYVSNAMGTIHPIETIINQAKKHNALVHLDLAQAIAHFPINVEKLKIDFCSFSAHKLFGPTGLGIFWGKEKWLQEMNPFLYGGEMIKEVFLDYATYNELPYKFEAGTPNIGDVIAFQKSIEFVESIGWNQIETIEKELYEYLYNKIENIASVKILSPKNKSIGALSFIVEGIHPFDIGQMLDAKGIAIRTGHHCCQPLMRKLGIEGTCRASISIYNTKEELDFFAETLEKTIQRLS